MIREYDVDRVERLAFGGCDRDATFGFGVPPRLLPDHRFYALHLTIQSSPIAGNPARADVTWGCACGETFVEVYHADRTWPETLNHGIAPVAPTIPIVRIG